ncbi:hypothetical protein, partial [Coprococcus comes]|uniref:hypothetical protein n=1 Tax=Coprococcus comes TaxID=410072 RepID=UPI001B3C560D
GRQSAASTLYGVMIIKDNMANMCAKVTSTYMEFTLAFGPKPEFSFSFKFLDCLCFNCKKHLHKRTYVCIIEI